MSGPSGTIASLVPVLAVVIPLGALVLCAMSLPSARHTLENFSSRWSPPAGPSDETRENETEVEAPGPQTDRERELFDVAIFREEAAP